MKNKPKPKPPSDLWEQLDEVISEMQDRPPEDRPPGVFTTREYHERHPNLGAQAAGKIIRDLVIAGKLEKLRIYQREKTGRWCRKEAYRLVK